MRTGPTVFVSTLTLLCIFHMNVWEREKSFYDCYLQFIKLQRGLVFKMTNAICESYNQSWVTIATCRLRAVQRNKTVLNVDLTLLQPVKSITMRLQVLRKANGYKPWIIDTTFDACNFLRSKNKNNLIAKLILGIFQDFSTFNHSCPYMVSYLSSLFATIS